jgi:V/A-type H+/Na+-transporting ATPase subunit D
MPDMGGEVIATRVAFLELKDERRLVQEGYELLDEKRVLLATEMLRQLRHYLALQDDLSQHEQQARTALDAATDAYGFDDLTVEPKLSLDESLVRSDVRAFLGIHLVEAALDEVGGVQPSSLQPLPEARGCARAFRRLIAGHVAMSACAGNLRRLAREYTRTERRARALENVVLPEIDVSLRFVEEQLDAVDQEEAVRVRNAAAR